MLTYDSQKAMRALCKNDRTLGQLIKQAGPITLDLPKRLNPFDALLRSIIYQQLSGKAAAAIHKRVRVLFSGGNINPNQVLAMDDQVLRNAGMSRAKVVAVNDLAQKTIDGLIPPGSRLREMSDADIVENLTQVRGIGEWTVQMFLMFQLGRPDVLPTKDLGVRKGFMLTYGLDELPAEKDMMVYCERWRPYRSVGSWYMWRALEL
ncbi:MAG: DNA-3-methyladenine glycosylase 2 family protein [Gemmatimonadota bacterium]|nr:DNA-3-methyladenine glycosylase 2 family protein [Gemmatimonadota bacterium]